MYFTDVSKQKIDFNLPPKTYRDKYDEYCTVSLVINTSYYELLLKADSDQYVTDQLIFQIIEDEERLHICDILVHSSRYRRGHGSILAERMLDIIVILNNDSTHFKYVTGWLSPFYARFWQENIMFYTSLQESYSDILRRLDWKIDNQIVNANDVIELVKNDTSIPSERVTFRYYL
jgi:hypothetical protein